MSKFTEQQANDGYDAILEIQKIVNDNDNSKGCRCMEFNLNGNLYPIHLEETIVPMSADASTVKTAFINHLMEFVDYIEPVSTTTITIENKV